MTLKSLSCLAATGALVVGLSLPALALANGDMAPAPPSAGGQPQSQNPNGAANSNAAEQQREGAAAAAGDQGQNNNDGGAAASPTDNTTVDQTGAITAVGQAQQADQAAQCAGLQREWISDANSIYVADPYREVKRARLYLSRVQRMTPAMLDAEVTLALRTWGANSVLFRWLVAYQTSLASGLGVEDQVKNMQAQMAQDQQAVDKEVDKMRALLRDVRSQMASLGCDTSAVDNYNTN